MDEDPFSGWGLSQVELTDQAVFQRYLQSLAQPLSDYTFSQFFTWRNSLRILWKILHGHLCIFANGTGDLTLLMPPVGEDGSDRALAEAFELMDDYNRAHGAEGSSRVEYASQELLQRFDHGRLVLQPQGCDYIYDVRRMIDLAGGDLASKRQARNRFLRQYEHRIEPYDAARHLEGCLSLLAAWKQHQDAQCQADASTAALKRQKELAACELSLRHAADLGLAGMVVWAAEPGAVQTIRGFTFGEPLGDRWSSIIVEKTDLSTKGLAQFIFSEFCARQWSGRPLVNVGDDWGLPTLAWTKMSYRPAHLLPKYILRLPAPVAVAVPGLAPAAAAAAPATTIRAARKEDLTAAVALERSCFSAYTLSARQLRYLQRRPSAVFLVAEQEGQVVGEGIALVRQHRRGRSGRIYSLAVSNACRRQGIGEKMLTAMLEDLAMRGVQRVYLEVEQSNEAAIRLYRQVGFRRIGDLPDYYGPGKHGTHMMCDMTVPELFAAALTGDDAATSALRR